MPPRDDLTALFDRVTEQRARPSDIARLDRITRVRGDGRTVQVGGYNVNLRSGRDIHIGGRLYRGGDADAIRAVLRDVAFDGGQVRHGARKVAGFVKSVGVVAALAGMALFVWGLISALQAPPAGMQIPPAIVQGFAIASIGVVISVVADFMRGRQRPRRG